MTAATAAARPAVGERMPKPLSCGTPCGGDLPLLCSGEEEGRQHMYGWIWRHLPGNAWVRALISLMLFLAVVYVLFQYIFPWAEPLLPFNQVTVDNGMAAVRDTVRDTGTAAAR
jgi:hypothetical protein